MLTNPIFKFLFALIVLAIPVIVFHTKVDPERGDFPAYYAAAKLVSRHHAPDAYNITAVHAEAQRFYRIPYFEGKYQFVGEPPFVVAAYAPMTLFTAPVAREMNIGLQLLATAAALTLLSAAIPLSNRATLVLIALTAVSGPYWEAIRSGKPSPFFLLAFCFGLWLLRRGMTKGGAAAFAMCLMKPHHITPFVLYALAARKLRFVITFAAVGLFLALASLPIFGIAGWINYSQLLNQMSHEGVNLGIQFMPTLRGQLYRLAIDPAVSNAIALSASMLSLLVCVWLGLNSKARNDWYLLGTAATSLLAVTFSFHCHPYDLMMLLPSLAILIQAAAQQDRKWMLAVFCTVPLAFSLPLYIPMHYFLLAQYLNPLVNVHFLVLAAATVCAVVFVRQAGPAIGSEEVPKQRPVMPNDHPFPTTGGSPVRR